MVKLPSLFRSAACLLWQREESPGTEKQLLRDYSEARHDRTEYPELIWVREA
jgi:hypothetical protein